MSAALNVNERKEDDGERSCRKDSKIDTEPKCNGERKDNRNYLAQSFEDMNLREGLLRKIKAHGFSNPTPLQQRAILPFIKGYDVVIQAHSKMSKKTTVAIGILQGINLDLQLQVCQALILSTSLKAAIQIQEVISDIGDNLKFQCQACVTTNNIKNDILKLKEGPPHIVVGNLERIYDLIYRGALKTHEIKMFVIDDADELLSGVFSDEIHNIITTLKSNVQMLLLSSFLKDDISREFEKILHYPVFSVTKDDVRVLKNGKHFHIPILSEHLKLETLYSLYGKLPIKQTLIFCQTKQKIELIENHLQDKGFAVSTFCHGSSQKEREELMKEFGLGKIHTLITNDFPMGGSIHPVSLIIIYDFPTEKENYIPEIRSGDLFHRIALSFVTDNEKGMLQEVENLYEIKIDELLTSETDLYNVFGSQTVNRDCELQKRNSPKFCQESCYDYDVNNFKDMKLRKELLQGIYDYGFMEPKPLQQKAIPPCVNGCDVIMCGSRGAGKTVTLTIATLQNVDTSLQHCQALVLAATRHNAQHILEVLDELGRPMNIQARVFIGGTTIRGDIPKLEKRIHVAVGTAGRIDDLIRRGHLRTTHIKMLVLDEISDLFAKQQRDQTRHIFQALNSDIQVIFSAASVPKKAMKQFKRILKEPICVVTPKREMNLTEVKQFYMPFIRENLIFDTISNLYIKLTMPQSVIFCNRKRKSCDQENEMFSGDLTVKTLFGYIDSSEKNIILKEFCSVCDHILISTGFLDSKYEPPVSVIVNYDFLTKKKNYICGKNESYFHKEIIVDIVPGREKLPAEELKNFLFS